MYSLKTWKTSLNVVCALGVFLASAFVADFPPAAPRFHQRTHRVRQLNFYGMYFSDMYELNKNIKIKKNLLTRSSTKRFREYISI